MFMKVCLGALGLVGMVGCAATSDLQPIKLAEPNPFVVAGCRAKMAQLTKGTDISDRELHQGGNAFEEGMQDGTEALFSGAADPNNVYTIKPRLTHWEPCNPMQMFGNNRCEATFIVEVYGHDGTMLDKLQIAATAAAGDVTGENGDYPLSFAARSAGKKVAKYLHDRWTCARGI